MTVIIITLLLAAIVRTFIGIVDYMNSLYKGIGTSLSEARRLLQIDAYSDSKVKPAITRFITNLDETTDKNQMRFRAWIKRIERKREARIAAARLRRKLRTSPVLRQTILAAKHMGVADER